MELCMLPYMLYYGALLLCFALILSYAFWLARRHPFLYLGGAIISCFLAALMLLKRIHDLEEALTYSAATFLLALSAEMTKDLFQQIRQEITKDQSATDPAHHRKQRTVFSLFNSAGVGMALLLVAMLALGYYVNNSLLPPEPPYMP